jgi:hypothetical protein
MQDGVDRATAMRASAVKLRGALAEQGRVLRNPADRRLSGPEVLQKLARALRAWSTESARFNRTLADDRQVVNRCSCSP